MNFKYLRYCCYMFIVAAFLTGITFEANAFNTGTISFLDSDNEPEYQVSATNPTDDNSGCDEATVVMYDQTGTATDIDNLCISTVNGIDDTGTDWGSLEGGYIPVCGPITYVLYDTEYDDICDNNENTLACLAYTQSLVPKAQAFYQPGSLQACSPPFSLLRQVGVPAFSTIGLVLLSSLFAVVVIVTLRRRTT